jgi:glycosyltransferase involved in cell wall biosynthesis
MTAWEISPGPATRLPVLAGRHRDYARRTVNRFSVILPAYDEGPGLRSAMERLVAFLRSFAPDGEWELIVVDDGSSDDTAAIADAFRREDPAHVRVLSHGYNQGLSAALASGAAVARGTAIVVMDADLSYAPETIGALVSAFFETGAMCALASPYMRGGSIANVPFVRLAASVVANAMLSLCSGSRVKTLTGMVRAYEPGLLRGLLAAQPDAEFNSWSVAEMLDAGLPLIEVPARLEWPEHRRRTASRLTFSALRRRTAAVLRSAGYLLGHPRCTALRYEKSGTFGPPKLGDRLMSGR